MLVLLRELNGGSSARQVECEWVLRMAELTSRFRFGTNDDTSSMRELALLLAIACWAMAPQGLPKEGLRRELLIERIEIEKTFESGSIRLINFVLMFVFLILALIIAGLGHDCVGIRQNLVDLFKLNEVARIGTWAGFREYAQHFSLSSALLSPLSTDYIQDSSEWMLLEGKERFLKPLQLGDLDLWIGKSFTLQAWVQLNSDQKMDDTTSLPIVRKAMGSTDGSGESEKLSCWVWSFPPSLSWGAHDHGLAKRNNHTNLPMEYIKAPYPGTRTSDGIRFQEHETLVLHTLLVNRTHATFMVNNGTLVHQAELRRPVTDCVSMRLTLGFHGLTLAAVRFVPWKLQIADIEEIFSGGSTMADIGYIIAPQPASILSSVESVDFLVREQKMTMAAQSSNSQRQIWSANTLTAEAVRNPKLYPTGDSSDELAIPAGTDPVLALPFWHVYATPNFSNSGPVSSAVGSSLPLLQRGGGFTISSWIKGDWGTGSGFLMSRGVPLFGENDQTSWGLRSLCWKVWWGGSWLSFSFGDADEIKITLGDSEFKQDAWKFTGRSYRHFVYRVDASNLSHPLMMCIDGFCLDHIPVAFSDGATVSKNLVDCFDTQSFQAQTASQQNTARAMSRMWFNGRPPNDWSPLLSQMGTKYFDRSLTPGEIKRLFEEDPDPEDANKKPIRETRGCRRPDEMVDDVNFKDDFGQGCHWYYVARNKGEDACGRNRRAAMACPNACISSEMCWGYGISGTGMRIWETQMEFRSRGSWGTTCVGKSTSAEREAIKCGLHAGVDCTGHDNGEGLELCLGDTIWNETATGSAKTWENAYLPCADIVRLHDPVCDWDDTALEEVAQAINQTKEWSIQFWFESLSKTCMMPQIRLLDGEGSTFSILGEIYGPMADPPKGTSCATSLFLTHGLRGKAPDYPHLQQAEIELPGFPKPGEKHLVTFGRRKDGYIGLQYDTQSNFDNGNDIGGHPPVPPGKKFLRVINVIGNIRISPLRLQAVYPSNGQIGNTIYEEMEGQLRMKGPKRSQSQQFSEGADRSLAKFTRQSLIVAPPLLIQSRKKVGKCSAEFSDAVVDYYVKVGQERKCSSPYTCQMSRSNVYQCPSVEEYDDDWFFGLQPHPLKHTKKANTSLYVEYLATVVNHEVLVRKVSSEGAADIITTASFTDTLTSQVYIASLFYSIETGIVTELRVTFDNSGGRVVGSHTIRHYVSVNGSQRTSFLALQCLVILCLMFLLFDNFRGINKMRLEYQDTEEIGDKSQALIIIIDFFVVVSSTVYLGLVMDDKLRSNSKIQRLMTPIVQLPWSERLGTNSYSEKKQDFTDAFEELGDLIQTSLQIEQFGCCISVVLLLRIVIATSAHPRISLVTSTLVYAGSPLFHFFINVTCIFLGFVFIASWRFGSIRQDLDGITAALWTHVDATLGPPGALDLSTTTMDPSMIQEYLVYCLLFHFICFFLMVNFVLAIIVDSYEKVVEKLEECEVEQHIVLDIYASLKYTILRLRHRFPPRHSMMYMLKETLDGDYVTLSDLNNNDAGFRNEAAAQAYFRFYENFGFLTTPAETDQENYHLLDVCENLSMTSHKVDMLAKDLSDLKKDVQGGTGDGLNADAPFQSLAAGEATTAKLSRAQADAASSPPPPNGMPPQPSDFSLQPSDWLPPEGAPQSTISSPKNNSILTKEQQTLITDRDLTIAKHAWQQTMIERDRASEIWRKVQDERQITERLWEHIRAVVVSNDHPKPTQSPGSPHAARAPASPGETIRAPVTRI